MRRRWFRLLVDGHAHGLPAGGPVRLGRARLLARHAHGRQQPQMPAAPQPLAQPDRTLVESLESRIAELETRLEFAERLMSNRKEESPKA